MPNMYAWAENIPGWALNDGAPFDPPKVIPMARSRDPQPELPVDDERNKTGQAHPSAAPDEHRESPPTPGPGVAAAAIQQEGLDRAKAAATPPAKPRREMTDIDLLGRINRMLQKRPLEVRRATVDFLKMQYDLQAQAPQQ